MPCGKRENPFVLNEFRVHFYLYFAAPSWTVHILHLTFHHALRPACSYHRIGHVQHALSQLLQQGVLQQPR